MSDNNKMTPEEIKAYVTHLISLQNREPGTVMFLENGELLEEYSEGIPYIEFFAKLKLKDGTVIEVRSNTIGYEKGKLLENLILTLIAPLALEM